MDDSKLEKTLEELSAEELNKELEESERKKYLAGFPLGIGIMTAFASTYMLLHENLQQGKQMVMGGCLIGSIILTLLGAGYLRKCNKEYKKCKNLLDEYKQKK